MAEPSDETFAEWIGRSVEARDHVTQAPVGRLAATLDHDGSHWPAGCLPPLGHWLFCLPDAMHSMLGPDGHPVRGAFFPPFPQARRMWAGGRFTFHAAIPFGSLMTRRTTIAAIDVKPGGMTFLTLQHVIAADGVTAVEEMQDLVYLPIAAPGTPRSVQHPAATSTRSMVADEAMLFRFSALTFNAHRIHYDLAYARDVELYPALVAHGPLQAMLLIDHAMREGAMPKRFAFRARAPLYAGRDFTLARAEDELWIRDDRGTTTMTASLA